MKCSFLRKYLEIPTKKRIFVATNPTTPLNDAYHGGTSLFIWVYELRQLIFKAIQDIEISLRTKMIQVFSMEHGAFWFMDSSLFKNAEFYEGCLDNIKKEVSRSNEDFIKEHSKKYNYPGLPPVWKTLEVVSFGTLSKLFCLFKDNRLKKQVAREFGLPLNWITPSQKPIKLYHQLCTLLYWNKLLNLAWT